MDTKIKILIVQKNKIVSESLKNILKRDYDVKTISNIGSISEISKDFIPYVVFINKGDEDSRELINMVKRIFPKSRVILEYEKETPKEGVLCDIVAGADGYLHSDWGNKEIKRAMKYLLKERYLIPREMIGFIIEEARRTFLGFREITKEEQIGTDPI